ncbi:MAG: chromate resistance protein ChrB domain-containing protein [Pseudomonadota bacterium]
MAARNETLPHQLMRMVGTPDAPQVVDIRIDRDFAEDPSLMPGSFRHLHTGIPGLLDRLASRAGVVVCQRGLKLSQGLAAWLSGARIGAQNLCGGMFVWRDQPPAPRMSASKIPDPKMGSTQLVTDDTPAVDRMACVWLIRHFIDHNARFLFVSISGVRGVAGRFGGTSFDLDGTFWSRRGPLCTFDTMLDEFAPRTDALDRMAGVIRASKTRDLVPKAAGLLAMSVGLCRQYADNVDRLEAGMGLYDALYRCARGGHQEDQDCLTGCTA